MKSPFPGMDPYLEAGGLCDGFHNQFVAKIGEELAGLVPTRYLVRPGERSYVVLMESDGKKGHPIVPDVSVTKPRGTRKTTKKGAAAVLDPGGPTQPITMRAFIQQEHREAFIEIYEATPEQRLVTAIEVLSPSNKRPNSMGWDLYLRKRQSLLLGPVNLVEIDLLRGGQRMPMIDAWPETPYTILVSRASRAGECKVWPIALRSPLPAIAVPLANPDADVELRLQPLLDKIYRRFRYDRSIDYTSPLSPPLAPDDSAWLQRQLRKARPVQE